MLKMESSSHVKIALEPSFQAPMTNTSGVRSSFVSYIHINNGDNQTEVSWWGQIFGTSQLCKPVERYLIAGEAYKYS